MRFHLKRSLQVIVVVGFFVIYLTFFFNNEPSLHFQPLSLSKNHSYNNISRSGGSPNYNKSVTLPPVISLYPNEKHYEDDRILSQLKFYPQDIQKQNTDGKVKPKKVLVTSGLEGWGVKHGQETLLEQKCLVPYCELTDSNEDFAVADIVLFQGSGQTVRTKVSGQIWVIFLLESPYHTSSFEYKPDQFNWTATYRHDSTIVAPYEKFVPFNASVLTKRQDRNYAEGKTKQVAWFVSNCAAQNKRQEYAAELAKYIQVDIYGACGTFHCPRHEADKCFDILNKDYKFYLSFENSNCRDYITEKFFVNGLKHDVLPIVMGAAIEDYERAAPPHSFIHVDQFESPKDLAEFLHKLDKDDKLYNEYFQWKGTGDLINTHFWCRLCALAHDTHRGPSWYNDVSEWWKGGDICIGQKNWREKKPDKKLIASLPIVLPLEH